MTLFDAGFSSQVCDRSRGGGGVGCFLESLLKAVKTNRDESLMPNSTDLETIGLGDVIFLKLRERNRKSMRFGKNVLGWYCITACLL